MTETVEVNATPAQAWEVIADFSSHAQWGGVTGKWAGIAKPGLRLRANHTTPHQQEFRLQLHVILAVPERELSITLQGYRSLSESFVTRSCYTTYHWQIEPAGTGTCWITASIGTAGIIGKLLQWLVSGWVKRHKGQTNSANSELQSSLLRLKSYIEERAAG